VNEFVEECRREWKRLRVPDQIADEMAAELAADLGEAQAEGGSAKDVLGGDARDPRSFAGWWAAERGVIGGSPAAGRTLPLLPVTIAVLALIAIVGAVLLIRASGTERRAVVVPPPELLTRASVPEGRVLVVAPPVATSEKQLANGPVWVSSDEVARLTSRSSDDTRTVGAVLAIVSLVGIVLLACSSLWLARRRHSRVG